jgi:serine acetyltransferase
LGINTTVLQNIKIGSYSKTGIGTVVTNDIKENTFVIGNPGRKIS